MRAIEKASTSDLVVTLKCLARNISHIKPQHRQAVLLEVADRLTAYRQAERSAAP